MKRLRSAKWFGLGAIGMMSVALTGIGSCSATVADICDQHLPAFDRKLDAAVAALAPWVEPGRGLASESVRLAPVDRESWRHWAETLLVDAQRDMDVVGALPLPAQVREELSEIATALVSFHGYARQGKSERMVRTLERIQSHVATARRLACPAGA